MLLSEMTKVELHYRLTRSLDDAHMGKIAEANSVYGILRVHLGDTSDSLSVDYDGSRLTPEQVDGILRRFGIPAQRISS